MASVLDFERYNADLQRQLLRRIGYTNGLHKIRRFARVVEYLYSIMPTSIRVLAQVIIREENKQIGPNDAPLKGKEYAAGIVDVAGGLGLTEKFGPKIALSSEGYACHALTVDESSNNQELIDDFLLERLIESDGEYVLNILRIISEGTTDVMKIGLLLTERFIGIIDFKERWVEDSGASRYARSVLGGLLGDARKKFEKAVTIVAGGKGSVDFFYRHTVVPRIEWLRDLGLIEQANSSPRVSPKGKALLAELRRTGLWTKQAIVLPLDSWLAKQLQLSNVLDTPDFGWRLVAACHADEPPSISILYDHITLLAAVKRMYPAVKLANFNEADALSIYHVLAAYEAREGRLLSETVFEQSLRTLVEEFPSDLFKLSKRRGRGLYIALKR
jgi:hypothetical protein